MPQIFTGKVVIPGEQLQPYLEAMAQVEAAREPFRRHLETLNAAFGDWLATKYTRETVLNTTLAASTWRYEFGVISTIEASSSTCYRGFHNAAGYPSGPTSRQSNGHMEAEEDDAKIVLSQWYWG